MDHELFSNFINTDQFSTIGHICISTFPTLSLNKDCGTTHCVRKMFWRDLLFVWLYWQLPYIKSQWRWE